MRSFVAGLFCSVVVLVPKTGNAQVHPFRTPEPSVTAAGAGWQLAGGPIVVDGLVYYATSGFRFFDSQVMTQVGLFGGVPVYADATLEPGSVVYVPIGRERMREYERRRDRELAGTTGSRAPSFPVQSPSVVALRDSDAAATGTSGNDAAGHGYRASDPAATSGTGTFRVIDAGLPSPIGTAGIEGRRRPRRTLLESVLQPGASNGVWLEYDGVRWYSAGAATWFSADRFEPVGVYRGFAVYRARGGSANEIWVTVVEDGPVAPYVRR